jgi:hypothetical protein
MGSGGTSIHGRVMLTSLGGMGVLARAASECSWWKALVMPQMSKVELYVAIPRDHRGGMSMRGPEREHGVTRRTVRTSGHIRFGERRRRSAGGVLLAFAAQRCHAHAKLAGAEAWTHCYTRLCFPACAPPWMPAPPPATATAAAGGSAESSTSGPRWPPHRPQSPTLLISMRGRPTHGILMARQRKGCVMILSDCDHDWVGWSGKTRCRKCGATQ